VFGDLAATSQKDDDYRTQRAFGPNGEILVLDGAEQRANAWHTDFTFTERSPAGALLSMQSCPARGGDTLWANHYAAHEALSAPVKELLDGLTGTHGRPGMTGMSSHPMVATHPETGRKAVFVNRGWTSRIDGLSVIESQSILQMLHEHSEKPEFTVRWSWTPGDAALWDNRCTQRFPWGKDARAARARADRRPAPRCRPPRLRAVGRQRAGRDSDPGTPNDRPGLCGSPYMTYHMMILFLTYTSGISCWWRRTSERQLLTWDQGFGRSP
jgi:hypothetical protein